MHTFILQDPLATGSGYDVPIAASPSRRPCMSPFANDTSVMTDLPRFSGEVIDSL